MSLYYKKLHFSPPPISLSLEVDSKLKPPSDLRSQLFIPSHGRDGQGKGSLLLFSSLLATQVINHYADLERMSHNMDLESGMSGGMWLFPTSLEHCCIYRVPNILRLLSPEAYTPQLVIIGPLHHSLKAKARKTRGDITNAESIDYLNMEEHKRIYVQRFNARFPAAFDAINVLRVRIEDNEVRIRQSYSESTEWIQRSEFVDMILHDSIFIMELLLTVYERSLTPLENRQRGDHLFEEPCLGGVIRRDLGLLENQLPYFILENLFDHVSPNIIHPIPPTRCPSFRRLTIHYFGIDLDNIQDGAVFRHFTDLLRCIRSASVTGFPPRDQRQPTITHMYNAEKLHRGGVNLRQVGDEHSLVVRFRRRHWYWYKGYLEIPCISVAGHMMVKLRNIMALEQCHYPRQADVCSYMVFLDYLIDTEKDVDVLVEKGIIKKAIGDNSSLAESVNKLCVGISDYGSYNSAVARAVNKHYDNWWVRKFAYLGDVYFNNCWRGSSTIAAVIVVFATVGSLVFAYLQYKHPAPGNEHGTPPARG